MIRYLLLLFLALCLDSSPVFGQSAAGAAAAADMRLDQISTKLNSIETRVTQLDDRVKKLASDGAVVFLFGAFCALWAQNTGRSAWSWFFLGLFFSVITVIVLLVKNSNDRFRESLRVKLD